MKTYKLDPAQLSRQKRNIILMYSITGFIMLVITLVINQRRAQPTSAIWLVPLILGLIAYSGVRAYRQRKTLWEDYALTVDVDGLTQEQPGYPKLKIPRAELTGMQEKPYGLLLSSKRAANLLQVPRELSPSDYLELKTLLEAWLNGTELPASPAETPLAPEPGPSAGTPETPGNQPAEDLDDPQAQIPPGADPNGHGQPPI